MDEVQKILIDLVRKGRIKKEDAAACVLEGQKRGESPLVLAVKKGLLRREDVQKTLSEDGRETLELPPPAVTTPATGSKRRPRPPRETRESERFVEPPSPSSGGRKPLGAVPAKLGHYELVKPLGEGGMGIVYEAVDTKLRRRVALKVLHAERLVSQGTLARFEQEARAAAKLKHPNVCPVFEVGELEGVPYYTMELIQGGSLAALAGQGDWRRIVEVCRDAALGLQHAHEQGIVHRDVKLTNVLIDEEGKGRLVDFGLAANTLDERPDRLTRSGQFMGTPYYLAPECVEKGSKEATAATDVYSLGVTLYEALSGKLPFDAETTFKLFQEILHGTPRPLVLPDGAPADVATVTMRALARRPKERYPTAAALANDLDRILRGEPIVGRKPTVAESLEGMARKPVLLAGVAAGLALLALGFGVRAWLAVPRVPVPAPAPVPPPVPPTIEPPPPPAFDPRFAGPPPTKEAGAQLEKARSLLWTGDLYAARKAYRHVLDLDPRVSEAVFEEIVAASICYEYTGGPGASQAIVAFQFLPVAQVIAEKKLVPGVELTSPTGEVDVSDCPVAALLLGARANHFLDVAANKNEDPASLESAETLARAALEQKPRCGFVAAVLANVLIRRGKNEDARRLLDEDRDYAGVAAAMRAYWKGAILAAQEKTLEADAVFSKIADPPWSVFARDERAAIWRRRGDLEASVAVYGTEQPGSIQGGVLLGRALNGLGRREEARKLLDFVVECAEQGGDTVSRYRASKRTATDLKLALFTQRQYEAQVDGAAEGRGLRARLAARLGDLERARRDLAHLREPPGLEQLEKAGIDVQGQRDIFKVELAATEGTVAFLKGDRAAARKAWDEAIAIAPEWFPGDAHIERAELLAAQGDRGGAIAACASAQAADRSLEAAARKKAAELGR